MKTNLINALYTIILILCTWLTFWPTISFTKLNDGVLFGFNLLPFLLIIIAGIFAYIYRNKNTTFTNYFNGINRFADEREQLISYKIITKYFNKATFIIAISMIIFILASQGPYYFAYEQYCIKYNLDVDIYIFLFKNTTLQITVFISLCAILYYIFLVIYNKKVNHAE